MNSSLRIKSLLLTTVLSLILLAATASADVFYMMKSTTGEYEMNGQKMPATEMVSTGWIGENNAFLDMDSVAVLLDGEKAIVYMLDRKSKTYYEIKLGDMSTMMESMGVEMDESQRTMMEQMMQSMMAKMKFSVTPTGEEKKIGDYNCKKYQMKVGMMGMETVSDIWATEDIKVDIEKFYKLSFAATAPFLGMEKVMEEAKKIKGFPVLSITKSQMMGGQMESTSELIEYAEKDAPEGTYTIPADYKLKKIVESEEE